jgi:hypothetical protein
MSNGKFLICSLFPLELESHCKQVSTYRHCKKCLYSIEVHNIVFVNEMKSGRKMKEKKGKF